MGGEGSGRFKEPAALIKEAKENDAKNLPLYFQRLSQLALEGDREALTYLIDRQLGKPKASTDIDIKGGAEIGAATLAKLFQLMSSKRKELLEEERQSITPKLIEKGKG